MGEIEVRRPEPAAPRAQFNTETLPRGIFTPQIHGSLVSQIGLPASRLPIFTLISVKHSQMVVSEIGAALPESLWGGDVRQLAQRRMSCLSREAASQDVGQ